MNHILGKKKKKKSIADAISGYIINKYICHIKNLNSRKGDGAFGCFSSSYIFKTYIFKLGRVTAE